MFTRYSQSFHPFSNLLHRNFQMNSLYQFIKRRKHSLHIKKSLIFQFCWLFDNWKIGVSLDWICFVKKISIPLKISIRSEYTAWICGLPFNSNIIGNYDNGKLCVCANDNRWILFVHHWFCFWSSRETATNQWRSLWIRRR